MELVVAVLSIFLALTLAIWVLLPQGRDDLYRRLAYYSSHDTAAVNRTEEESFRERVLAPLLMPFTHGVGSLLPGSWAERVRRGLVLAGNPAGLTPERFTALCLLLGVGLPGLYLIPMLVSGGLSRNALIFTVVLVALGFYLPWFWLRLHGRRRQNAISDALPDAMDHLTVSVEAGLGLEAALARVSEKMPGPLSQELQRMLAEISLGTRRREALRNLAARTDVPGVQMLTSALVQADQMGITLGPVLRAQADQLRVRRRQIAEEKAMKAPLKILFPLVIFILPSVFIVVLVPAILRIIEELK